MKPMQTANDPQAATLRAATLPAIDGDTFRAALSRLAAGVTIVTTRDARGILYGLTATAVTSLSLDPPLLLVCADNRARAAAVLRGGAGFVVHVLAADQAWRARQFASAATDKFAGVAYAPTARGLPRLDGVLASIECMPYQRYPGGDHTIVRRSGIEGWGRAAPAPISSPDHIKGKRL